MNTKLVGSLAEVIEFLTPDEYQLLQEELKSRAIASHQCEKEEAIA